MFKKSFFILLTSVLFYACDKEDTPEKREPFLLNEYAVNGVVNQEPYEGLSPGKLVADLRFSFAVDQHTIEESIELKESRKSNVRINIRVKSPEELEISTLTALKQHTAYELWIWPTLKSTEGEPLLSGKVIHIKTDMDTSDKFPRIPDEELLTLVQQQTFRYFWDFGHPVSGMARERSTSNDVVTTGGTGFGIMAMVVAAERNFITHREALERIQQIVGFLDTKCTTYHGAFAHWINGATGATQPFSQYDNGADLVETALLFQGLLTARQYFASADVAERQLREDITRLWEAVEWDWFCKNKEKVLYWHWSPEHEWHINLKINGWNESLIVYALAASSPTYPIDKEVYETGWTRNGAFVNGKNFYGYPLPLGPDNGGPLFLSQYSFLGIDPKAIKDQYTDYWTQNRNHSLINYSYCVANPKNYAGYGRDCWGLTASDGDKGYSAHSPSNDKGVIAPTAALSAMPYTPEESMRALHFFYYKLGDKLWKEQGFADAFNLGAQWYDNQHIAIDQGPIILMIENHRTGLLWSLFMADTEIQTGLRKLGLLQ